MSVRRIFSGIQPTGVPHIGNYLGAIKNWVKLQDTARENDVIMFCVVDLHSCTTSHAPKQLNENIYNMFASLMACGLDPNKSLLFQQSKVPHHTSLAWLLGCLAPFGQLRRMHQWKTKSKNQKEKETLGLFSYPTLMAADILLYNSTHVPVGHDQIQHLEFTRNLTEIFNRYYGQTFHLPDVILTETPRVMSLRNPTEKMSKSDKDANSRIDLSDTDETITHKIKKAVTDSEPYITHDLTERPGVRNLVDILSALTGQTNSGIISKYEQIQYFTRVLKSELSKETLKELTPIRERFNALLNNRNYLDDVIETGSRKAEEIARETIGQVYEKVGLK